MSDSRKPVTECGQSGCDSPANFRYTWPGRDEAGICLPCAAGLRTLATAIGLHVQLIPLTADDYMREAKGGAS